MKKSKDMSGCSYNKLPEIVIAILILSALVLSGGIVLVGEESEIATWLWLLGSIIFLLDIIWMWQRRKHQLKNNLIFNSVVFFVSLLVFFAAYVYSVNW